MRRVRRGDFLVPENDLERAEETFSERSSRSRAMDKAFRAPITEDVEEWEADPRGLDYPGVDTPSEAPREALGDFPLLGERARFASNRQEGVRLSPEPGVEPRPLNKSLTIPDESMTNLRKALGESRKRDKSLWEGLF